MSWLPAGMSKHVVVAVDWGGSAGHQVHILLPKITKLLLLCIYSQRIISMYYRTQSAI